MSVLLIVLVIFLVLLLLGFPIAFVMGISGIAYFVFKGDLSLLSMIPEKIFAGMDLFVIVSIPFFLLAGELMNRSGISDRLISFSNMIVGRLRGGLAQVVLLASLFFAGIAGTAIGAIAALGIIFIPAMEKQGYERRFSSAVTAAGSIVSPIIPPSIIIIIYGALMGVSIGGLFVAAIVPGVLIWLVSSLIVAFISKKRDYPKNEEKYTLKEYAVSFKDGILALLMPFIILAGILSGIFTPTEAAAAAVAYAFLIGAFVFRKLKWSDGPPILFSSMMNSAKLLFILATACILGWIFAMEHLPNHIADFLMSFSSNRYVILLLVNVLLLFIGTWLDVGAALILFAPILVPVMKSFGFDPIHFGIVMIINLNIGLFTPPVGTCLYVSCAVGNVSVEELIKEVWPFLVGNVVVLLLLSYIPDLVMALPRLFGLA